ncbi:hypothetical protein SAMN05192561_101206 [Halopenitus malekzadehii]|uniref:Uncharacterized protein n=1 Tax=Halopenitus malekzadehii TaxID=1267564 RepID=A0A1H6HR27_9EURY|nr:hypothetical protein [Halopenitus malekzadehii]SEH37522.1 hypothetical protein SAMN05192561_101206 [Halopenitus malekzadehii]
MVRPSRRGFLGGSALTLAALTGTLDPDRVANSTTPTDRRNLDELSDSAASAIAALPDDGSLDLSYRLVVTTNVADADVAEDLSHEARVVTRELDVAAADLSTVVTAITHDYRRRITVASGTFDRLDRGEELTTVGDWRVADDGDREGMTTVSTDGVAAFVAGEDRSGRVEAARAIAAAAGEADGEDGDRLVDANADAESAFGLVESFDTVLFAPDAAESGFQTPGASAVGTGAIRAFAGGFEIHPARLHGSDDRAENRYLFFTDDPSTPGDRAVRPLIEAIGTGIVEETAIDRSGETIRVDAVLEAPPEHDHENAPDIRVGTTVDREADGTSGDGEADGTGSGQETGGVTLEHRGGETVTGDALEALQLWVDGELADRQPADRLDRFEPGDTLTVETDPLASVVLRWFDAERNAHRVYANEAIGTEAFAIDHEVEAETVTITYVGDREADAGKVAVTHRSDDGTVRTPAPSFGNGGDGGNDSGSGTLTNGDAVTIEDVGMGDVVSLTLTVPSIPGVHRRPLQRFRVTPPRIHVHDHPDRGLIATYHGEEDYDASAFRVLVDGEPADRQIADEVETLSRGTEIPLGEHPVDSTVTIEWLDPEEPVVVAEHEVVPEAFVDLEYDPEAGTVRVEHREGDAMAADRVRIRADGEPLGTQPADEYEEFGPGDALAAEVPPFAQVEVVWVGADDDAESGTDDDAAGERDDERDHHLAGTTTAREALKAHYDPGAAEMRLTYVGAQPADPEGLQVTTYSPADGSSDRTSGRPSGSERETLVVAEEYDELTSGDTITLTDVGIGDRVTVSIRTETANMVSERSVGHYPTEPRHGFTFQSGSEQEAGTGTDGRETGTGTDQRKAVPDDGIAAIYRDPVSRDAGEFRLLVDGEAADTQPADEHDVLERGDVVPLSEFDTGTTFTAEWTPPTEPIEVGSHVIAPTADFAVDYDAEEEAVTVTHDGGGAIAAEHLSVVVTPDPGEPEPWDGDAATGSVQDGDSTTIEMTQEPHRAFVLFGEHEVIHEARIADRETSETRSSGAETSTGESSASGSASGAAGGSAAETAGGSAAEASADAEAE